MALHISGCKALHPLDSKQDWLELGLQLFLTLAPFPEASCL